MMMHRAWPLRLPRLAASSAVLLFMVAAAMPAAAQFALSPVPPLVSAPPPTNVVLTIDDSGSMQSAFVPDSVGNQNIMVTLAFTSSAYNALYYNPNFTYTIPPNAAGLQASYPSAPTSFTAAYLDGFNPAAGTVDLSNSYAPTLSYQPGAAGQTFATPDQPVGNVAYYYTYIGGTGCTVPVPWNLPPPDTCFAQTVVLGNNGPATLTQKAGWDERQNFATWYSFYRTRHLSIASAAAIAMSDPGLAPARVAWQDLVSPNCNNFTSGVCTGWQASVPSVDNRLHTFIDTPTSSHRSDFYTWLFRVPAGNTTPTRLAWSRTGNYFMQGAATNGQNSAYILDPNDGGTDTREYACVNNFQITMTDGEWNTFDEGGVTNFCGGSNCGNMDTTAATFPDGTSYTPSASTASSTSIYSDYNAGGLADIAFYYWSKNLRPDLAGSATAVKPYLADPSLINPITQLPDASWPYWNPRNDPATWPHLVNFTIGVGLTGYLTLPGLLWVQDSFGALPVGSAVLNANGYSNLLAYANVCTDTNNEPNPPNCNWPTINPNGAGGSTEAGTQSAGGNPGNVYDLWHAAIDSRGQTFSAESPLQMVSALKAIVNRIEGEATGSGTAAGSTSSLATSTVLYLGTFHASDWHGTLAAYAVDGPKTTTPGAVSGTPTWTTDTAGSIPAVANRNVYTSLVSAPVPGGTALPLAGNPFNATDGALQASPLWAFLASGPTVTDQVSVVNYLLGDASNEAPLGLLYRARPVSKLGDIVDSTPILTSNENLGYQVLETGTNPEASANYLTYVSSVKAARPAMVYVGANDGMLHGFDATAGDTSTVERLAYVPHSAVPNLPLLANTNYAHRFYVDSTPYVGDAFFNGSWRTVVVGATGAGGKGVFALDVTRPQSFTAADVLWDMDGTGIISGSASYGNGDPDLGYTIGQPAVVRANDGHWYAAFGNGYLSTNSCAALYLVRLDNGNISRKIFTAGTPSGPCATPNGLGAVTPLDLDGNGTTDFIYAGDLQGNLWKFDLRSSVSSAWAVSVNGGQLTPGPLFVAQTGGATPAVQSIVGAPNLGPGPNGVMVYFSTGHFFASTDTADTSIQSVYGIQDSGVAVTRSSLVQQTVTTDATGNRIVSQDSVNLMSGNNGWVIDLPSSGERVTQQPFLIDNVVVFVSEIPDSTSICTGGCTSYLFGVSALTGAGGMNFFSSNGTYYDAIASQVGCLSGLTAIVGSGSSVYIYGFGQSFGGGSGSGSGGSGSGGSGSGGGASGPVCPAGSNCGSNPKPPPVQPPCPPGATCTKENLNNSAGRISWHEMVQ